MHRPIVYTPPQIDTNASYDSYYGVCLPGVSSGAQGDRAIIAGIGNFPKPQHFRVLNFNGLTKNNNWNKLDHLQGVKMTLKDFIIGLYQAGFEVIEFPDLKSLGQWISEQEPF